MATMFEMILGIAIGIVIAYPLILNLRFPKLSKKIIEVGDELDWFIDQINKATNEILIVAGEAHIKIYDNNEVLGAFERAHKRGVNIHMIAGPQIVISSNVKKDLPLYEMEREAKPFLRLASKGVINLNIAMDREPIHFTLIDSRTVYKEERHAPFQRNRVRTIITNSFFEANRLRRKFQNYLIDTIPYPEAFKLGVMKLEYEDEIKERWLSKKAEIEIMARLMESKRNTNLIASN